MAIEKIAVCDTIPIADHARRYLPGLQVLSVSELLGEAIHRIHNNRSVSELFRGTAGTKR